MPDPAYICRGFYWMMLSMCACESQCDCIRGRWEILSYRSQGVRSLQCCRPESSSRSDPRAAPAVRSSALKNFYCSVFLIRPIRCRSNCAVKSPADPAPDWLSRRSHGDAAAVIGYRGKGNGVRGIQLYIPVMCNMQNNPAHTITYTCVNISYILHMCVIYIYIWLFFLFTFYSHFYLTLAFPGLF